MNNGQVIHVPEQPVLTEVTSIGQTPLLEAVDQTALDPSSPTSMEKTHFPTLNDSPLSEEQDHEDADSLSFNSSNSFSGYDSQKFPYDMGHGDIVDAYGPR